MDENSNKMGDNSIEPQVHGNNNNSDVSRVIAAAKLIKNLSQNSLKNVPTADDDNGNNKLVKQTSTDSAKELAKVATAASFVRSLSKQSMELGHKDEHEDNAAKDDNSGEGTKSAESDVLAKATKAAKLIKQLSKTAMMASSNSPSIDEEANDEKGEKPPSGDMSKVVKATQIIKRLSEQSMEKEKPGMKESDSIDHGNVDDNEAKGTENGDVNQTEDGVETASRDAVLGDDDQQAENVDEDEPEEGLEERDPAKVAQAAALVRQLSKKKSMTRTESAESRGEAADGEKTEVKRFKGKWRKSVKERSRETSLEVQEKIVEAPEKEGDIAEHPEAEKEAEEASGDDNANKSDEATKTGSEKVNNPTNSEGVITKQPSAGMESDGDAIKTIESTEINPKPKTGFCPCL